MNNNLVLVKIMKTIPYFSNLKSIAGVLLGDISFSLTVGSPERDRESSFSSVLLVSLGMLSDVRLVIFCVATTGEGLR